MSILVINAGSSSVKCGLFDSDTLQSIASGLLDWDGRGDRAHATFQFGTAESTSEDIEAPGYRTAVVSMLEKLRRMHLRFLGIPMDVRVVGHRLIHGGEELREPVCIDASIKRKIRQTAHLAPLHISPGLDAVDATEHALPDALQTGLFDTAFFAKIPPAAFLYPVPFEWYEEWGIRRFGFHGISHSYCTHRAITLLKDTHKTSRIIICHLGQGASATAVLDGAAVMNTMGFTPLEGLPMGTRSGTVDPGMLLHVQREHNLSYDELDHILHKESGLLGLSGVSADFRRIEAAAADGHERANLALDVYAHRVRSAIGALAVSIGGLDTLVFTGGIGENSSQLRINACRGLECLGVQLDPNRNEACEPDADIASGDSPTRVLVIRTREEFQVAREARRLFLQSRRS